MNEILLYTGITADTAASFIQNLSWIGENQVYSARLYCPGGDIQAAWGMWAKMNELKAKGCHSIAKVDGMAASMGAFLLAAFDEREALEVSSIMLHRGVMPEVDANGNKITLSTEDKILLAKINNDLKSSLLAVIDNKKLKELKGYDVEALFDEGKDRINCWLTAEEAYKIGLITKIIPLASADPQIMVKAVAACYTTPQASAATAETNNNKKMTKDEFIKENPEAVQEIEKEAVKAYKAKMKAKAKAADDSDPDGDGDDDDDPVTDTDHDGGGKNAKKAKADAAIVAMAVEQTLKAMGIAKVEGGAVTQTAQELAKATAEAEKAKAEKDAAVNAELEATKTLIANIKAGKVS